MPDPVKPSAQLFHLKINWLKPLLPAELLLISALLLVGLFCFPGQTVGQTKKIVFLAEPKDHGVPDRHEYEKDLRLLAQCLENSPNLKGVSTQVYVGRAPRDLNELKDASAIVILSSSDRAEDETLVAFYLY